MKHHFVGGRFRIGVALLLGIAVVGGAYVTRGNATASADLDDPRAFVAALPLREYQETVDTDGDGLRDWFEELTGTDPRTNNANDPNAVIASPTTTPFVADTETEKFAVEFFEEMLRAKGGGLTEQEKRLVVNGSVRSFKALNEEVLHTRADVIIIDDTSSEALRAYGNSAAAPILTHGENTENVESELVLLGTALAEDDPSHLADLSFIEARYGKIADALLAVPVPVSVIDEHLLVVNALRAMQSDVVAFQNTFTDPLVSYVRFKRYLSDVEALARALEGVRTALERERVVYQNDEPGSFFFSLRP